jgi:hypothetical protein|tara:strand:+ start:473 stop:706 length:234 start_codon:yes stop_codon:yes gene_type:complete
MKAQTKIEIRANAYVLTQYNEMGRSTDIVGVYPTREAAELAKTRQDEFGGVINSIHETTLYGADHYHNLETLYSNML